MGNKTSASAGASNYTSFISSLPITDFSFQRVEKLLTDKAVEPQAKNLAINHTEFTNLVEAYWIVPKDKEGHALQSHYFTSLYIDSKEKEDSTSVNIYWLLLKLVPLLDNSTKEKAKAFYKSVVKIHGGPLTGIELKKVYFDSYLRWNLITAPSRIGSQFSEQEKKDSIKHYLEKVANESNVHKILQESLNLIAPTDVDLKEKSFVVDDLFLVADRLEYPFHLKKVVSETLNRFRPEDE